jgi:hypothetical protein
VPAFKEVKMPFRENASRLYHWTRRPGILAERNRGERELRILVIARKPTRDPYESLSTLREKIKSHHH